MDNKEERKEVSLPGAGGAEPTILEVLNRNVIGDCDSEESAQQQPQELHQPKQEHRLDDINDGRLDDSIQLVERFATSTLVTDLDVDDNEIDNDHSLALESDLAAEGRVTAHSSSHQVLAELDADSIRQSVNKLSGPTQQATSVDCDIVPFGSTAASANSPILKLVNQRLPVVDNSNKRLSSVEEQSNESESSYSDDNNKLTVVIPTATESETNRPWYLDDDLDPEDQRIIQEAVESILNDAKKQVAEDKVNNLRTLEERSDRKATAIQDISPLQAPYLLLSSQLYPTHSQNEDSNTIDHQILVDSGNYSHDSIDASNFAQKDLSADSGLYSLPENSSIRESDQAEIEVNTSLLVAVPSEATSPDSGVESPDCELDSRSARISTTDSLKDSRSSPLSNNRTSNLIRIVTPTRASEEKPSIVLEVNTEHNTDKTDSIASASPTSPESDVSNSLEETSRTPPHIDNFNTKEFPKDILNEIQPESPQPEFDLSSEAKREYYQYLRDYLNNEDPNRPPVPLKTYQWEDLRRAKKQGGYPWTHIYKRPLGPDEEPELLTLRRSQDRQKFASESPRSAKKVVRIHDEVLVKETERYISDLSDNETDEEDDRPEDQREEEEEVHIQHLEVVSSTPGDNYSVQSEPILSVSPDDKSTKITRLKGILKRRLSLKHSKPGSAPESRAEEATPTRNKRRFIGTQRIAQCCTPIMNKLKSMADKQLKKRNIKKVPLKYDEKIVLSEKQKILKLKASPKADHSLIPHFIEKQDSDDVMEILQLEESPSKARKHRQEEEDQEAIPVPDEIIELPLPKTPDEEEIEDHESFESPISKENLRLNLGQPPQKSPRLRKDHVYEDIDDKDVESEIDEILQEAVQSATRISQQIEEEMLKTSPEKEIKNDMMSNETIELKIVEDFEKDEALELKSALKRESSPGADKRVTFSHTEDDADPHREDITLPEEFRAPKRWSDTSDHEYEPIGQPLDESNNGEKMDIDEEVSSIPTFKISEPANITLKDSVAASSSLTSIERKELAPTQSDEEGDHIPSAFEQQREIEERYFSSIPTTPRTDSRTDNEIHTSQVDSSALEELPLKAENRKKGFMASAQDRSRKVSQNIRSQAGKITTKIRGTKKPPSGSPKAKERKRFKRPDFSKIKMPEIKRPELPKFKAPEMPKFKSPDFKRPEFTKFDKPLFTKPDLSRFKIPDTMAFKLKRSRSFKESEVTPTTTETTPESATTSPKKRFDFNFGTYPRMLRKRKQKISTIVIAKADDLPSTETPPSVESTTLPRQEGGPVSPRWNEKFSEASYGDSESGKYQRYGSEVESLGRESSMERRMREDLERSSREQEELEMIHSIEGKQFADYDEENRAIHEISKIREGEFKKRRPMVHQDSDVVSEESKDVGWSEKDAIRNAMLRGAEESDQEHLQAPEKYTSDEGLAASVTNTNHDTQSTASSGNRHKGVIEEIDDDEFILRKRGISQDNIEIRQYISSAIREGLTTPINALAQLGSKESYYPDVEASDEQMNFGYDVPPPKPKRVPKHLNDFDRARDTESRELSQEFEAGHRGSFDDNTSLPAATGGYFANIPPNRPFRRSKKHYRREEDHEVPSEVLPYLDDEEDNALFKKMNIESYKQHQDQDEDIREELVDRYQPATPPKAPKRRRKQRESIDKDSYANRFSGRSISNSFLPSEEREEDFIVYRTQHEYIIPLAQAETFSTPTPAPRRSRSQSHMTDDDRTSRGADSFASESFPIVEEKFHIDIKENDGYATVRKDPPPRPPAPIRHRKPSPLPEQRFSTMPHTKREVASAERSKRDFHTFGPSRPPRRKSTASMEDSKRSSPDVTQYEELDIDLDREENDVDSRVESPRGDLHSGDVINKMKYRPLPPPPRPPRESRRRGRRDQPDTFDNKFDKDDGAERIACDLHMNGDYNVDKNTEKCIEVEVSTQTDPLPDDFSCEEFEITDDMRVIEPRVRRRLEDFLDEGRIPIGQHQDDDSLTRSLQRFREASQRSFSEKSRASTADRSRISLGSRPTTPSAIVIEKRVPTPIPHRQGETMLEASILVLPVDDLESDEEEVQQKAKEKPIPRTSTQEEEQRLKTDEIEHESVHSSVEAREDVISDDEIPPIAPPRKRSSLAADVYPLIDENRITTRNANLSPTADVDAEVEQQVDRSSPFPTRLTLAELSVDRLNVTDLQAGNITVSQLQSSIVKTDELECRSSNMSQSMELPPGLIDEIIKRIRGADKQSETIETQTPEQPVESSTILTTPEDPPPPPRPPLPHLQQPPVFPSEYMQYSIPPPSFYSLRDPSEGDHQHSPTHRRRRHHRRRESSSEDDSHREHRRSRHSTRSPEPTIGQLGGQLLQACGSSVMQSVNQIVNILRANAKEGNDRNISTAIVLVILVTIGFLLLGITGNRNIHHHHWDYFNPPDNKGR